ncbi:hypothetical protein KRP22_004760 [Phytophthora ramorum]|nr:hypothetical protein KRP22_10392 [Phytophthora ramorum]
MSVRRRSGAVSLGSGDGVDDDLDKLPAMVNISMDVLGSSVDSLGLRKLLMGYSTANDNRRGESDFFALSVSGFNTAAKP